MHPLFRGAYMLVAGPPISALLLSATVVHAKRDGQNFACVNCHEGQDKPQVVATLSAMRVEPGQAVTITVNAAHPTAVVGGVLVDSKEMGTFELVDATGTRFFEDVPTQVTHAEPNGFADGQVEFTFNWIAPETIGPVEFEVWANAANDNMDPHDDHADGTTAHIGVGCDALWYYLDADGDGRGEDVTGIYSCDPMTDRINVGGDCDDQNPAVHADVVEVCNDIDDDCDGEIDEDFEMSLWVTDADGDGFGAPTGESRIGCAPQTGFAPNFDDCNDDDPAISPDAAELMNGIDDNCNGMVDEMAVEDTAPAPSAGEMVPAVPTSPVVMPSSTATPVGAPSAAAPGGADAPASTSAPASTTDSVLGAGAAPPNPEPGNDPGTSCAFGSVATPPAVLPFGAWLLVLARRGRSRRCEPTRRG